ncbi:hypothetical protein [Dolichospermum compactum]|uniref:Uncharacterized protein n=1 Tax=Dolichospermum compactum NIES-806 TaxID=1973481 RepID=A0A1Z4V9Z9_9CYAN|nr:hypothetical protein [Dolichospermum compactum]BAZ88139.1 hypothetical protein NIES806_43730 [Dolichospermum compactum NIES-806]
MTLTFNSDKYKELLTAYLPKDIRTEAENEQALVDDILNGNQKITPELTQKLADFFHVEANIFHE